MALEGLSSRSHTEKWALFTFCSKTSEVGGIEHSFATHEEADAIIVAQAIYAAKEEGKHVVIVADDTDVYILPLYHYKAES